MHRWLGPALAGFVKGCQAERSMRRDREERARIARGDLTPSERATRDKLEVDEILRARALKRYQAWLEHERLARPDDPLLHLAPDRPSALDKRRPLP